MVNSTFTTNLPVKGFSPRFHSFTTPLRCKFLRCLLGVRDGTPNASVLGELAAFPLAHTAATLLCRFWNRLVDMPEDRLAKQAFLENVALTASGTDNVRSALLGCPGGLVPALHAAHRRWCAAVHGP